jgi:hypothetical protein
MAHVLYLGKYSIAMLRFVTRAFLQDTPFSIAAPLMNQTICIRCHQKIVLLLNVCSAFHFLGLDNFPYGVISWLKFWTKIS